MCPHNLHRVNGRRTALYLWGAARSRSSRRSHVANPQGQWLGFRPNGCTAVAYTCGRETAPSPLQRVARSWHRRSLDAQCPRLKWTNAGGFRGGSDRRDPQRGIPSPAARTTNLAGRRVVQICTSCQRASEDHNHPPRSRRPAAGSGRVCSDQRCGASYLHAFPSNIRSMSGVQIS